MNNPLRILHTLEHHLTMPAEITLFGRAAMALGYPHTPSAFGATEDVDAILPLAWLDAQDQNLDFWDAQQQTNAELAPEGLYITHLIPKFLSSGHRTTWSRRIQIQRGLQ